MPKSYTHTHCSVKYALLDIELNPKPSSKEVTRVLHVTETRRYVAKLGLHVHITP